MISLTGPAIEKYDAQSAVAIDLSRVAKDLGAKDSSLWGKQAEAEAERRLNWIDLPITSRELLPELDALSAWAREHGLSNIILCGMGGSSLAPEVIAKTYEKPLTVLDSTDPDQISLALPKDLTTTLVIVGSKSGATIETASQKSLFEKLFIDAGLDPREHFVVITDPHSPLDIAARAQGLRVVNADPQVGGRFSALSAFGLVPAALMGVDVSVMLDDAELAIQAFSSPNSVPVRLATLLFEQCDENFALIDAGSKLPGIGDWIEQLIAESTGKDGTGRLPIVLENQSSEIFGDGLRIGFSKGVGELNVLGSLGEQFILWEWATALLCRALQVDPFNQPNVTEAKKSTANILSKLVGSKIPETIPAFTVGNLLIFADEQSSDLVSALGNFTSSPASYIAIMAYLNRQSDGEVRLIRESLARKTKLPVTFGWGPRFLHSTGQFHKGGKEKGIFLQITANSKSELQIPGEQFSFQTLLMAQALGDAQALEARGFKVLRLHLVKRSEGISELFEAVSAL